MQHPDWQVEHDRVERVVDYMTQFLKKKFEEKDSLITQQADINRSMWEETGVIGDLENISEFLQHINLLKQNMAWSKKTAREIIRLDQQRLNPYFGRIDFQENGEDKPTPIYIGIYTVTHDETGEILVYDWRAPVSGMFYDFETGPASYKCPAGLIRGSITLKRQYRISGGKLVFFFDSSVAIQDDILQELLANNTSGRMKSIVSTIQKEQNTAIRHDTAKVLAVQGTAGSGKTSVAMHRASYLLYRNKKSIETDNLIILSSTDVLGDYIADVLPDLGEEPIKGTPYPSLFERYYTTSHKAETQPEMLERILTQGETEACKKRLVLMSIKSASWFTDVLDRLYDYALKHMIGFETLSYKNQVIATKEELEGLFYRDFSAMPVAQRFKRMEHRIQEMLKPIKKLQTQQKAEEMEHEDVSLSRSEAKAMSKLSLREEAQGFHEKLNSMLTLSPFRLYEALLTNIEVVHFCFENRLDGETKRIWLDGGSAALRSGFIPYEDSGPLLYLSLLLGTTEPDLNVRHVMIDEAQDYSRVQLLSLSKLFSCAGMTLLGDVSQNINPYESHVSLKDAAQALAPSDYAFLTLNKSYRSTVEITQFASQFLTGPAGEPFGRRGDKPVLYKTSTRDAMERRLRQEILKDAAEGRKTIAVITKTSQSAERLYDALKHHFKDASVPFRLVREGFEYKLEGMMVIPSYLSKGLEFDSVHIVFDHDADYSQQIERGLFYTVLSRALHKVSLYSDNNTLPAVLSIADSSLYEALPLLPNETN
ncbi:MAG: AAA family ATPase [Clostridia bacterium]|nr:AAA family ATPase [Clostridia bacterium]